MLLFWKMRDVAADSEVLNIPAVPGVRQSDYADEMHILASAVPAYTHYLIERLSP